MLLRDLGRRVAVARVEREPTRRPPAPSKAAEHIGAARLEQARLQILAASRRRRDGPCSGSRSHPRHRPPSTTPAPTAGCRPPTSPIAARPCRDRCAGRSRRGPTHHGRARPSPPGDTPRRRRSSPRDVRLRDITDLHLRPRGQMSRCRRRQVVEHPHPVTAPTRASTTWDPTKPQPPVTKTCTDPPQIADLEEGTIARLSGAAGSPRRRAESAESPESCCGYTVRTRRGLAGGPTGEGSRPTDFAHKPCARHIRHRIGDQAIE